MPKLISACLVVVALMLGASALSAKSLSKIIREIGLTPDDYSMLSLSGQSLYETASPRPGKVVSWTNPDSKSHGTAKLAAMRDNCAYVQHLVFPKGATKSTEIRNRVCRDANGNWVLQP